MSRLGASTASSNSAAGEQVTQRQNKDSTITENKKDEGEYSFIDATLKPERILQIGILGLITHLSYDKYYNMDFEHMEIMQMGLIAAAAVFVGIYSSFKSSKGNSSVLPEFNTIYLIFIPFMMSLLFDQQNAAANIALVTNCLQMSPFYGIPMQMIFIAFHTVDTTIEEKYGYLGAVPINYFIYRTLAKVSCLKSLDKIDCNLFSILLTNVLYLNTSQSLYFLVLKKTLTAFVIVVMVNSAISFLTRDMSNGVIRSMILFSVFLVGFPLGVEKLLVIDDNDPLGWLINYIAVSKLRQTILFTWLGSLLFLIPNILTFKSSFTLNTSRKVWHFLILVLISHPFRLDPEFVKISLSGTIVLFLCVEYLRYLKLEPFGEFLDSRLRSFADFRDDKGPLIISYIYLIIGIATPLLISDSPVGLIGLGVGDSLASIVGGKWGKTSWPGTGKTIEGTGAFIAGTSFVSLIFKQYLGYFKGISSLNLILICGLSGVLEGNSFLNDNILIPAFMLVAEQVLS
ncbi:hypothetical protein ZYGR_0P02390 [Zygosaccharomyces rouxii]|uniref:dolichol kinase n=2 Tax=Zygosaccharomyces rouxii TaxID=4956 RepID=C5E4H4_ZYGRC|nr:uncharacterized protein ZYRO0E06006g [Zygosaccharomyces rouxii]KAH9198207.1 hypothetical protein LQ764DRAFT_236117 [Zygosaccharomyces rouxii]GAV49594.1 hypothetical protein ZYGR_0P02390 [Zygosaccharomyces rouxii]CAR30935.1 ZYRO0E06006p [Zygosaccharomyces rouxii]